MSANSRADHLLSLCSSSCLCRFKNVIFEISPSEAVGVFDVKAKLMGVHLETLQIEYQVLSPSPCTTSRRVSFVLITQCLYFALTGLFCFFTSQDLLQLQYEGVAVMKLFGRATVNVNLLIFLLNKKFYGK